MYKVFQKDSTKLYVGVVAKEPKRYEKDGVLTMIVTLRDFSGNEIDIFFKNNPGSNRMMMRADRIINAKVTEGVYLSVLAKCDDPEEKRATGIDFKYRGIWSLMGVGERPTTVLMGVGCKPRKPKTGMFSITIPVDEFKDGNKTTKWVEVTFFDSERGQNAAQAEKVFAGKDKAFVVAVGGSIQERDFNGNTYHNMVGYRLTRKPD